MAEKPIKALSKIDMLEMLHQQEIEIERLNAEREEFLQRLDERQMYIQEAGSIAEASMKLSGVMTAAQEAADVYLENIRILEAKKKAIVSTVEEEVREKTTALYNEAERRRTVAENGARWAVAEAYKLLDSHAERLAIIRAELSDMAGKLNITEEPPEGEEQADTGAESGI